MSSAPRWPTAGVASNVEEIGKALRGGHQLRLVPAGTQKDCGQWPVSRKPLEARGPDRNGETGAIAGIPGAREDSASFWRAEMPLRRGRRNCCRRPGARRSMFMPQTPSDEMIEHRARRPSITIHRRAIEAADLRGAAMAIGAFEDDARGRRLRRAGAQRRRAGQRDRQAGVLRFRLRRDRQPLAAGDRHLDRRRRAGVRPGDPRQARSADPARLCALGRGRAAMAPARAGARAVVPRTAPLLGALHRARGRGSRSARRRRATSTR